MDNKRNKAMFGPANNLWPIVEFECFDEEQKIWKGRILKGCPIKDIAEKWIFFSRHYDPNNDVDRMLREYKIPKEIFGQEILLVHHEKFLFFYGDPSVIIQLPRKISRGMGRHR
jgi:hypothetical protein